MKQKSTAIELLVQKCCITALKKEWQGSTATTLILTHIWMQVLRNKFKCIYILKNNAVPVNYWPYDDGYNDNS
jgi:hypothetical protein